MDEMLSVLNDRLRRFLKTGTPAVVLDSEAIDEADQLWNLALREAGSTEEVPSNVVLAVGALYFFRFSSSAEGEHQDDLAKSMNILGPLVTKVPGLAPQQYTSYLESTLRQQLEN